jgi:hypothetical protein
MQNGSTGRCTSSRYSSKRTERLLPRREITHLDPNAGVDALLARLQQIAASMGG